MFVGNCASMDINLMTMKKVDAGEVNIIMDSLTYVNKDEMDGMSLLNYSTQKQIILNAHLL